MRPLDPAGRIQGSTRIGFRWYPPDKPANGSAYPVITAIDGGPGYGATRSAADYRALIGDLGRTHALLLVDNRGTGTSDALACDLLDGKPGLDPAALSQCGARLGPAAAFYGSALAADDLAALLDALGIARTGLYAVSYGTWFAQYFAARHPERLERMVLDSAYPVRGANPFFPTSIPALRRSLATLCERHAATCSPEPELLDRVLAKLREHPVSGIAPDSIGGKRRVTLDPGSLYVALMQASGGLVTFRDFPAAAHALLDRNDPVPLLRLVAEGETLHDASATGADPRDFSKTLFGAVSCSDLPKLFDITRPPEARRRALAEEMQRLGGLMEVYSPFTLDEVAQSAFQENKLDLCLDWPWPADVAPPRLSDNLLYPAIPVLVLTGELDTLTTVAEGAAVTGQFPNARHRIIANHVHAPALLDPGGCAAKMTRALLGGADTLGECPARMTVHAPPPSFERTLSNDTSSHIADIARWTALDVASRYIFGNESLSGLRGGIVRYLPGSAGIIRMKLNRVRWVTDAEASGTLRFMPSNGRLWGKLTVYNGQGKARITVKVGDY